MITLSGQRIYLRALEPEDLLFVYEIENDENIWEVSNTNTPYSKYLIKQYLQNAHQDLFEAKQLRLAICLQNNFKAIGLIDLFDYDPRNQRAGIGIVIKEQTHHQMGYGTEALGLLINYTFKKLHLKQLFANINPENLASITLFHKFGFQLIGTKKQWNLINGVYKDENLYQLINF
ncbi:GNAT family N-acetyltransferase [Flavobacterium branchiophilum NBRC 15030 = ATCC 35035]|uniref:N-acetyltransferase n=1 Tax=Flavobacterium branchiophilum TaxID=55197 RepID=A0A2H3KFC1_9FLAO|nr:GNAT family protein [Flavobacterium branchiophilum]OXA74608.1 GNAT family N-acetyltransferase [Flavobacterium branchiophilum NBRC 15030 = ATCC 35035]PDS21845.1 N-acetyltransferase [Flavobacterium branchiophilum]TQM40887.1 diamine N-acetyltransferase [Flavobacterium branchiophilum]GEM54826.1 acetyltransferase [Flavobacterium branchiophilum NBRC 15030 = ATCC 35035]